MLSAVVAELDQTEAADTLDSAGRLTTPLAGVLGALGTIPMPPDEPNVVCVAAAGTDAARTALPDGRRSFVISASGVGLGHDHAAARAVGEVIERYSASFPDRAGLVEAAWREVGGPHPDAYALFSAEQWQDGLPYARFEEDTVLEWVAAQNLIEGGTAWVPAKRVFLVERQEPWLANIGPAISTGLACARTRSAALLAALLEVVERDAFALTWWRRLPTAPVLMPRSGPLASIVRDRFGRSGLTFLYRLLPTDLGISVVLVVALDPKANSSVAAVGAAARLDPAAALLKALMEAVQTRTWLRQMGGGTGFDPGVGFANVRRFSDHVRLYGQPQSLAYLGFLGDSAAAPVCLEDLSDASRSPEADLGYCLERLERRGLHALAVDLTTPDLAECGFVVVRVLVPGLLDIAPSHAHRFLGYSRLWEMPERLGLVGGGALNPYPHPFP